MKVGTLLVGVTAALFLFVAVANSSAYRLNTPNGVWPNSVIRYYVSDSTLKRSLAGAARNWNSARVGYRFAATKSRSLADAFVKPLGGNVCRGNASLAYMPRSVGGSQIRLSRCPGPIGVAVAAHELGHVLGLDHERRKCVLMNPGSIRGCKIHTGPQSDDVAGARRLASRRDQGDLGRPRQ